MALSEDAQFLELDGHHNTDDDEERDTDGDADDPSESMATTSVERLVRSVSEVLNDRDAVEAFKKWTALDESRCPSSIDLHFTIKCFSTIVDKKPQEAPHLAIAAHKQYISKKTGSCSFLPDGVRSEMSRRAHSIKNGNLSRDFFDIVIPPVEEYLRQLHANFISSEAFVALTKAIVAKDTAETTPSTSMGTPATIKKERASSLATSSPSTSSVPFKSSSPFPFRVAAASAAISTAFKNPFRTYTNDSVKQEPVDVDAAIASKQRHANDQLFFVNKLEDKLQRLKDEMEKRGVQFARDLNGKGDNFADLTEESIDKDIDDYADRMDARGKSGASKRSDSRTPPATNTVASPAVAPLPVHHFPYGGINQFAPPPSNRLRRKYMDTLHNTTAVSGHSSTSPTAGTKSKKGRPSMDLDSSSSGFYSGHPSSSSSAFSSHFSAPHFNTLRRPTHGADIDSFDSRVGHFPTLARPSFVTDSPPYSQSPYFHLLTPNASPSPHDRTTGMHSGFCTLPRSSGRVFSAPGSSTSSGKADGKILLRVTVTGNRPMVFRTEPDEGGMMTLQKFRSVFGLRKEKNKFFFKNYSEDDSSDYQWDLVTDDSATVPLYHGSITAECRPALDSPE
ncbi:hypothetical protein PMAYCL1PPCAC_23361 [Pristionchus mayeri]|uniref:DIX domain-containing protein n=1 Tax=Pristionchus mayeri TaxID=1317129 RepID=A0AAN5CXY4_9BILA|nr:hypothetical protein PMAYCL1PPCAC_23361 [Pristionchus mayeri]